MYPSYGFGAVQKKHIYQNIPVGVNRILFGSEPCKNTYAKTSLPAETSNKRGSELNSTHIPKPSGLWQYEEYGFGAVQICIYQNDCMPTSCAWRGSEPCKKHIYQNIYYDYESGLRGSELCKKLIYQNGTFVPCFRR